MLTNWWERTWIHTTVHTVVTQLGRNRFRPFKIRWDGWHSVSNFVHVYKAKDTYLYYKCRLCNETNKHFVQWQDNEASFHKQHVYHRDSWNTRDLTLVENINHPAGDDVFRCQSIMANDYKICAWRKLVFMSRVHKQRAAATLTSTRPSMVTFSTLRTRTSA